MRATTRSSRLRHRLLGLAAAGALVAAAVTHSGSAVASSPTEGTVTDTSTSVSWTGGPFALPNTTGTALDAPDCTAPQSCDDFTLHVSTPAGYDDSHSLKIEVSWPETAADFDVYVLDQAGNPVGQAASSADPEQVVLPPTTGTYTVRVVPFLPLGQSYTATATLVDQPVPPPPGTATPPGFTTYAAPSGLNGDVNNAGEPSIGTNWKSGATMYQSSLSTYKVTFDDSTSPATAHWSDVSATAANGCPQGSTFSLDPILFTDHATGRTFESQLSGQDSLTCYTDDDGQTWSPSTGGGIPSGVDHQTIGGGPYSPNGLGPLPTSTYPDAVYYCSQDIATAFCAASHDGGTTFGPGVPTYSLLDCGGLHGHVKVAPDGTAYLPNKACGSTAALVVSKDGGTSWTVNPVPGSSPSDADPSVGVGANGTVYFGYVGSDGKPAVAVSHDQGTTWSAPQTVGTEFGVKNAVFPAMVAGDDNRATLAYIGTTKAGNYQSQTDFKDAEWHLYLATTYDGGKTWVSSDATPNDPVQRGSICTGGTTCGNDRNLLDFIDVTVDKTGHVEAAFADGCIDACVTDATHNSDDGPADAQAAYATIARQSSGLGLFSAYDPQALTSKKHKTHGGKG
ncbi:MAG TPA: sialidase family protein [Nocardioides sp.]|uniref:sialidase family protein n=1 Tax=Nocardioides sp. TaxID=35761 RepID=UPI002F3FBC13